MPSLNRQALFVSVNLFGFTEAIRLPVPGPRALPGFHREIIIITLKPFIRWLGQEPSGRGPTLGPHLAPPEHVPDSTSQPDTSIKTEKRREDQSPDIRQGYLMLCLSSAILCDGKKINPNMSRQWIRVGKLVWRERGRQSLQSNNTNAITGIFCLLTGFGSRAESGMLRASGAGKSPVSLGRNHPPRCLEELSEETHEGLQQRSRIFCDSDLILIFGLQKFIPEKRQGCRDVAETLHNRIL